MSIKNQKILVVEDDEVSLIVAEHILTKEGYAVRKVDNGEEAIEIVRRERFDLILMDIEMPIMSGLEATPLIREHPHGQDVPIVALTAHSTPEKLQEFQAAGIDDYVLKPLDAIKLQLIADKYLNGG